jgi:anthranilate synthase/aminodeoxychorismate synthase-like glutamine amidotransferase
MEIFRNDQVDISHIESLLPNRLLISPGPCTPVKAGISIEAIKHFAGRIPVLGVCLGHQSIGEAFGSRTIRAPRIMHGKTSPVIHDGKGVFTGLPNPFEAMRYHSLIVERESLPDCLEITARTDQDELMGIRHKEMLVEGVQFHPESIMTPDGVQLLKNFIDPAYPEMFSR